MNNLRDFTLNPEYAVAFGYTQEELESNFEDYIKKGIDATGDNRGTYLEKLKVMYDGYRFAPARERVYNPVSIGSFFSDGGELFDSYWAETGGTKLLRDTAKKLKYNVDSSLDEPLSKDDITYFDSRCSIKICKPHEV